MRLLEMHRRIQMNESGFFVKEVRTNEFRT